MQESNAIKTTGENRAVAIFSSSDCTSACAALRLGLPLKAAGWPTRWGSSLKDDQLTVDASVAHGADIVVIQRSFPAATTLGALRRIASFGIPMIYDLDDAIFHIAADHRQYEHFRAYFPYVRWMLRQADLITVSTQPLAAAMSEHTSRPIVVVPNMVDFARFDAMPRPRGSRCNVLVSGTPTHRADWELIEPVLSDLLSTRSDQVRLTFFGDLPEKFRGHPAVTAMGYESAYLKYAEVIKNLDSHISLVPLLNSDFNRSKSNIKWLEYSAAGIPGIYSDVEPYRNSITDGHDGLLVKNTHAEWKKAIYSLIDHPQRCAALAAQAKQAVFARHSIASAIDAFKSTFGSVVGTRHNPDRQADLLLAPAHFKTVVRQSVKGYLKRQLVPTR